MIYKMKKHPCRGETSKILPPNTIEHNIFYSDTYDNNMILTYMLFIQLLLNYELINKMS